MRKFTGFDICSNYEELKVCQGESKEVSEEKSWNKMKYITICNQQLLIKYFKK